MSVPKAGQIVNADSLFAEHEKAQSQSYNVTAPLEDPVEGDKVDVPAEERPVAPDQFDPKFETSPGEVSTYYTYYVGNNGLSLFNFAPTLFQDLLYIKAGDAGVLHFLGQDRTIYSIVLLANGISFAIQVVLFLILGSYADFGSWRPWILIFWTTVAISLGFGWLGVHDPDQWKTGTGLYMIGLIAYQTCLTFWTAAFPGLARNTPEMREKAVQYENRQITRDEYDFTDMMQRNRFSNTAFIVQSIAEVFILAVLVGILFALNVEDSQENNLYGLSVLLAFTSGVWVMCAIPWFLVEKRRPGQKVPAGMNIVTVGIWNLWRALKSIWKLKQSLLYLIGYFLLGDSLNTTVTVVATLQNSVVSYSSLTLTYLLIVGIAAQLVGIFSFWRIQKYFRLSTKTMFDIIMLGILVLDLWGMIGIFTNKFGFHNIWEFWVYQTYYGLFVCPWYSYSQTMISEVTPRGKEFLFFSLFSIMGKTSAFIGPIVSSAIIDADTRKKAGRGIVGGNESLPFYFLVGLSALSFLLLFFFVDLKKSRQEQAAFLEEEWQERVRRASVVYGDLGESNTTNKGDDTHATLH